MSVKRILVAQVVNFLREPTTPLNLLSSVAHVTWVMETCGQGFCLPMEEEATIIAVAELYRRWALEPFNRPPCIEAEGVIQSFLQDILRQFSLIFQPRSTGSSVDKQAQLCSKILDIYLEIGRTHWKTLSLETWEIFLKVLLGIADSMLSASASADAAALGLRLGYQVLKVVFNCGYTLELEILHCGLHSRQFFQIGSIMRNLSISGMLPAMH